MNEILESIRIDDTALLSDLQELAEIGATEEGGVERIAYGPADLEARDWVRARMTELDLRVRLDAVGNTIARYPGEEDELPPLAIGSHTDTVPRGGRFDGALGVLAGLAALRALHASNHRLGHPIELLNFCAEEGTMSGVTFGSKAMAGGLHPEVLDAGAWDGRPVREHLTAAGYEPEKIAQAVRQTGSVAAYLELHIEQGQRLIEADVPVGVVEGIVGIRRYEVHFRGQANHAGTTTMEQRQDALVMAAPFITAVREAGLDFKAIATIGVLRLEPGAANIIPGHVELVVETRAPEEGVHDKLQAHLSGLTVEHGAEFMPTSVEPAVQSDKIVISSIEKACQSLELDYLRLASGAGHDAMAMAALCPQAMLFVPSRRGISHSPEEYTTPQDCIAGANVLLQSLIRLDGKLGE